LTKGSNAFVSQHVGDLENMATYDFFKLTIDHLKRILDIEPELVAYDLHPDYLSTRYANEQHDIPAIGVQHHHAHIASCMAENKVDGPVIGLAFDGTGYGTDGKIWGGEILIADVHRFERAAHLAYIAMPGSAAAIKEPWRMAVSYLYDAYGEAVHRLDLDLLQRIEARKIDIILEMIQKGVNCPQTSSLGRLFDGVAALIGLRDTVAFEGQAAMELEMLAAEGVTETYPYAWTADRIHQILPAPIIKGVVADIAGGVEGAVISAKFHATLIRLVVELCAEIRRERGMMRVALSGGVFQNTILLDGLIRGLEQRAFEVYTHKLVPTNDGGIALGQAVIADALAS
jgi:hydrogenase maturation protein HypF